MSETPEAEEHHSLRERLHQRLVAAELAAEGAAGYGPGTELVEAADSAVNPEHATGLEDENDSQATRPAHSDERG